jgi:uncharacterized protein (TIGR04551 family)
MRRLFSRSSALSLALLLTPGLVLAEPPAAGDAAETPEPEPTEDEAKPAEDKPKAEEKAEPEPEEEEDDDSFGDDEDDDSGGGWDDEEPAPTYPRIEHHGYLRFRADMFGNLHLGTAFVDASGVTRGTSSVLPPLTENAINNDESADPKVGEAENDETFLASANMRFRYQPTFLISESIKIAATFDVLDNLVLGSTPDFDIGRPDAPRAIFATGQAPPGSNFQIQDSIRVKELYGEWKILGAIPLRFGRMKSHWGLGILANSGEHWDDDYGDYNDRIMLALQFFGIYFVGGYDIVSSGPTYKQQYQPFGQAYDLTETDDVTQGFFGIFQRPLSKAEQDARTVRLNKERKPSFDWGVYTVFRRQKLDVDTTTLRSMQDGDVTPDELASAQLIQRDALAIIPDAWFRFEYRPKYSQKLRLELEFAMIYANVTNINDGEGAVSDDNERDVLSFGLAFEGEFTHGGLTAGLFAGVASGDDSDFLAVNDSANFADQNGNFNKEITNFKFDRNYRIDMIMFREVMGTITNAWYARPFVSYDLFADSPDEALGGELAVIFGGPMEGGAYPSNGSFLGTEFDLRLFYEQTGKFLADLAFGLYIPGDTFDLEPGFLKYSGSKVEAGIAWTLQTHLVLQF